MKPFDAAYLRMTAWYVVIIMIISLLFSVWVYNQARNELQTGLNKVIELKPMIVDYPQANTNYSGMVSGELNNSRGRLLSRLVLMNVGVLVAGSLASYLLARRTMRPIEESVEAQERFTADASHELRTPLAAMKTEIEVGLRQGKKLSREDAVTLLKSNLEEVERLGGLADGLLALTQQDTADLTQVDLDDVVGKTANRLRSLARAKDIDIKTELQPVRVQGDIVSVDKIVGILLDNAIKYSPEKTTVMVRAYQKDGHGYVAVEDQGIGIKASELPHIFDRFYRADTSRSKTHIAGHGLGLSIAKKLAENMGASLEVKSAPNKGSVFTLLVRGIAS